MFERKIYKKLYEGATAPFKIINNVYFVGCVPASAHLIDTGDGLILIDTGYKDTLFLLINSIYELGFNPKDIKYIINTHWHGDHCEATAPLASFTGAKTFIGAKDYENAKKFFDADVLLKDKDKISLGNTVIEVMETPGHTIGCISLFFNTVDNGKAYRVGTFGGAGANTLIPGAYEYDDCVSDYLNSVERLKAEHVDVFIGNHVWNNDTVKKGEVLRKTGCNEFIDSKLWIDFLDFCKKRAIDAQG